MQPESAATATIACSVPPCWSGVCPRVNDARTRGPSARSSHFHSRTLHRSSPPLSLGYTHPRFQNRHHRVIPQRRFGGHDNTMQGAGNSLQAASSVPLV
ncbi:hypothetical protein K505DRAFT_6494 [Melanomma pulvis-pyrius CBS 109.77]|uniref:Uncharacterized protein n=1 Tax=Melanomma pulvis-pyrius CBS 109.77 TaxID=1314802 RepID=A0A6A6XHC6_9PLEO|nr:hypothetical protein K505DRAFT_6494 [Melanomma pulvis-pyrius CBS 109.77]